MPVEERRRVELRNVVTSAWGEEAADTLFDLMAPSGHEPATREDVDALRRDMEHRFDRMDERMTAFESRMDARMTAFESRMDERMTAFESRMDERGQARLDAMEHRLLERFEHRIADAVTTQTRTLVFSQLGALLAIAAIAFGLR